MKLPTERSGHVRSGTGSAWASPQRRSGRQDIDNGVALCNRWLSAGRLLLLLLPLCLVAACTGLLPSGGGGVKNGQDPDAAERRFLNDSILVVEATDLLESITLLEKLARLEGDGPLLRSRILFRQNRLQSMRPELLVCGEVEVASHPRLARRCLMLAHQIDPAVEVRRRLRQIEQDAAARKQAQQRRSARQAQRRMAQRITRLLREAEAEMARGAPGNALVLLQKALKLNPQASKVKALLAQVKADLERRVVALTTLGDRLYREQRSGAAIAVWDAALTLDPGRQSLIERIERGRRVQEKLQRIRSGSN